MSFDRRSFVTAAAAAAVSAPAILRVTRAGAAEYQLKLANNTNDSHPLTIRMREAAANIARDSGGKIDMQVFPNNQLGGDTDMLSQFRSGALEFFSLSGLILSTLVPAASINGIGFAFPNYDKVWSAMDGELGAYVRARDREVRPLRLREDLGQRLPADHLPRPPIKHAGGPHRLQDPRARQPALDLDVQGLRCRADDDQFRRSLFGAADQGRRGPGKSR